MDSKPPFTLPRAWDVLPRMMFSRAPASSVEAEAVDDIAYGVRDADTLASEFDNRERRLLGRTAKVTKK